MTPAEMASRLEEWPLSRLIPYARNPRTHSPEQIDKIARSIQKFDFTNPILVDENDGILAGHGRLLAAKQLKRRTVPVIVLTGLSEDEKRAYIIADNRLAQDAGWDYELLRGELEDLDGENFDLTLTGFEEEELEEILKGEGEPGEPSRESEPRLGVFVNCSSQRQQRAVVKLLEKHGYECRAIN